MATRSNNYKILSNAAMRKIGREDAARNRAFAKLPAKERAKLTRTANAERAREQRYNAKDADRMEGKVRGGGTVVDGKVVKGGKAAVAAARKKMRAKYSASGGKKGKAAAGGRKPCPRG